MKCNDFNVCVVIYVTFIHMAHCYIHNRLTQGSMMIHGKVDLYGRDIKNPPMRVSGISNVSEYII